MTNKIQSICEALTFDDVLLVPAASDVHPLHVDVSTKISQNITLNIPLLSAAMDTVTESRMAIAMAQAGGLGVIHRNMTPEEQAAEVAKVKRFEAGMVMNPVTLPPEATLQEALDLMAYYKISGIPVTEKPSEKLLGILTNRDVRFASKKNMPISQLMTKDNLITVEKSITKAKAKKILHQHRIEKLLVVDKKGCCIGLMTVKDIEKAELNPGATKDKAGHLRVAAAVGAGEQGYNRAVQLVKENIDMVVIDTAHGHAKSVIETVSKIAKLKKKHSFDIMAGNVATGQAAEALIKAGADSIKVGIGPGSICTTRIVAGVGVPQLTAIMDTVAYCEKKKIPVIADGGIKYSGDIAKAIAGGAHAVMIGSLFAGTEEAPGEMILFQGRSFKAYRGMGSLGAMQQGSADRYFQDVKSDAMKLVPEGVEGRVPYKGNLSSVVHQMVGGIKAAMGYTGNINIESLRKNSEFVKISGAGMVESHVHDIHVTKEAPNYRVKE